MTEEWYEMKKRLLGNTGLEVTELCFGALPMGPLQKNLDLEVCAGITELVLRKGINFIDTAEMYRTYEPIKMAMDRTGIRPIIASKSQSRTYEGMNKAVNEALDKLDLDYIDIFHLHAAREGYNAFEVFEGALNCLIDMKKAGKIKNIGISTHSVDVVKRAAGMDIIDVVFPLINVAGRGVVDGTRDEMAAAIEKAARAGKGIYIMKALAGGTILDDYDNAMKYVKSLEGWSSIAVGMVSKEEVEFNTAYFNGDKIEAFPKAASGGKRVMVFKGVCKGCKSCMKACPNSAISMDENNKADINPEKCLTCGYCTPKCPQLAIRLI